MHPVRSGRFPPYHLEKMKVPGGILLTIIGVSIVGLIFDPNATFKPETQLQYVGHLKLGVYLQAGKLVGL
ncbi:hypothetical protein FK514_27400, partial [Klebsiella pneumoniae]|nr:hypothetical protein [Klebsiella pneumoniae]